MTVTHTKNTANMKDSGVEWIGEIPEGWDTTVFKALFKMSTERVEDDPTVDQILSVSGYRGVEPKNIESNEGQMPSEDVSQYRIVRKGQLVVNTMWLNYAGLGVSEYEGFVSPAYRAYDIKEPSVNRRFIHYLLRSHLYVGKYTSLLYGIRPNSLQVKPYDFERLEILVPPTETQKKIVDFLDRKTAQVDVVIEKKKRMIELLKEKRTSIITHAVTKGLDPKAKMRDSGVEWIGEIPEGWGVTVLKRNLHCNDGGVWGRDPQNEDDPIVLRSTEQNVDGEWKIINPARRHLSQSEYTSSLLLANDLLVTKSSGSELHIGKTSLVTEEVAQLRACYSNFMQRLRLKNDLTPKYLFYVLNNVLAREQMIYFSNSSISLGNINSTVLNSLIVPFPSVHEQELIVVSLNKRTLELNNAIQTVRTQIAKLTEYRASLIYHAVTGKMNV
jgi:type I restriction enzyme, S subunit